MDRPTTLAKLTAPHLGNIYSCARLHAVLEQACARPVAWIVGAPGAGKTTLVAGWLEARKQRALWYQLDAGDSDPATFFHYLSIAASRLAPRKPAALPSLTPEHLPSLGAFARRYFENLGGLLRQPMVLVLDNYQDVAPASPLHALLTQTLPLLPVHVQIIVISRTEPPAVFARLRINRHIALIGADEFKLSTDEAINLVQSLGHTCSPDIVTQMHRQTEGWAAGLVLLLERARNDSAAPAEIQEAVIGELFDYFAAEVLHRMEPDSQRVLLQLTCLPDITALLAGVDGQKTLNRVT